MPNVQYAQTTLYGGRGLLRTQSAELIGRSKFYVNTFFSTFLQSTPSRATLGKDHTLNLGLTYGISRSIELTAFLTPYQDDQKHVWGPPGDSQLGLKFKTPFSSNSIFTSVFIFSRFPTAKSHNVPFEPYSSGKIGAGALGIITFDFTDSFPLFPLKAHVNFGYFDQNIKDELFNDNEDQFIIAAGIKFPIRSSILYTEYSAEVFASNPLVTSYSWNSQRITQGLKLLGPWNLILDFALDISLSKKPPNPDAVFLKEYASWKVIFGVNYQLSFKRPQNPYVRRNNGINEKSEKKELPKEVHENRQKIQDELQRMEKNLEKDKKKEKDKEQKSDQ